MSRKKNKYRKTLSKRKIVVDNLLENANNLYKKGELKKAEAVCKKVLSLDNKNISAIRTLAYIYKDTSRIEDGISFLESMNSIISENPVVLHELGIFYIIKLQYEKAAKYIARAHELDPENLHIAYNLAWVFQLTKRVNDSLKIYKKIPPDSEEYNFACENMVELLIQKGRLKEAMEIGEKALAQNSHLFRMYYNLARIKSFPPSHPYIKKLENLLKGRSIKLYEDEIIIIHYTLGKIYGDIAEGKIDVNSENEPLLDSQGKYDHQKYAEKAFEHYKKANDIQRREINYNFFNVEKTMLSILNIFSQHTIENFQYYGSDSKLPVFIVGMPRSGTTLVEQIIASHPNAEGAGELNAIAKYFHEIFSMAMVSREGKLDLTPEQIKDYADSYLKELKKAAELNKISLSDNMEMPKIERIADKMPDNFKFLGLISILFPQAKIIHCKRNPLDTCISCYFQNFRINHPYKNDISTLRKYYELYEYMMRYWKNILGKAIFEVQYEELVKTPEKIIPEIIQFCGLEPHENCFKFYETERFVSTTESSVRRKLYTSSIDRHKIYKEFVKLWEEAK